MLGRIHVSRFIFLSICLNLASTATYAVDLIHVREGQSYRIAENTNELALTQLILEDNAVLLLPKNVPTFSITASSSRIGKNVKIIGRGDDAAGLNKASNTLPAAVNCTAPENGAIGASGADGIGFKFITQLLEFGSLSIDLSGGAGGDGLAGGLGQDADQSSGCEKQSGGRGGEGGSAGFGGAGGDAHIQLSLSSDVLLADVRQKLVLVNAAGIGGQAGVGGKGGKGSAGRYINRKSLYGNKTWVAGGKKGQQGALGLSAQRAQAGRKQLQLIPAKTLASMTANDSQSEASAGTVESIGSSNSTELMLQRRIELLEAHVASLLQRIDALEQAKN